MDGLDSDSEYTNCLADPLATETHDFNEQNIFSMCDQTHSFEFVCTTCKHFLCSKCAVFHLREPRNHEISILQEANQSLKSEVQAVATKLDNFLGNDLVKIKQIQNEIENIIIELIAEALKIISKDPLIKHVETIRILLKQNSKQKQSSDNRPLNIQIRKNRLFLDNLKYYESIMDNIKQGKNYLSYGEFLDMLSEKIRNIKLDNFQVQGMKMSFNTFGNANCCIILIKISFQIFLYREIINCNLNQFILYFDKDTTKPHTYYCLYIMRFGRIGQMTLD